MRISRLYWPQALSTGQQIEIGDEQAHYVRNVLRLKKAAPVVLFNGQGGEWAAQVVDVGRKKLLIAVGQHYFRDVESPLDIHLGLTLVRAERMDWAIQKAVELGVNRLSPLLSDRCVVQLKEHKAEQKLQHWRKIVQNAAQQCGRTVVPPISRPCLLAEWLAGQKKGLKLFLQPQAGNTLAQLRPQSNKVTLLSGPEGGFAQHEQDLARQAGFVPSRLGKRVLRAETAALSAVAVVQALWGDLC